MYLLNTLFVLHLQTPQNRHYSLLFYQPNIGAKNKGTIISNWLLAASVNGLPDAAKENKLLECSRSFFYPHSFPPDLHTICTSESLQCQQLLIIHTCVNLCVRLIKDRHSSTARMLADVEWKPLPFRRLALVYVSVCKPCRSCCSPFSSPPSSSCLPVHKINVYVLLLLVLSTFTLLERSHTHSFVSWLS